MTDDNEHPRQLIPELCKLFYTLGWVTGTGVNRGGISIRAGSEIYIAPSGVQKERIQPEHLYILDLQRNLIQEPSKSLGFKPSQCTPLFFNAFDQRQAGACIHTHSQAAVLATLLFDKEFIITHQEMIKGIRKGSSKENHAYYETIRVPIIENTAQEEDLQQRMAVIIYFNQLEAKTQTECYDYLFQIAVEMKKLGIDPTEVPEDSEYKHLCG